MAHRTVAGTSFGHICVRTATLLRMKFRPMLIGALSFALLSAVIAAAIGQKVGRIHDQITLSAGLTREQLQTTVDHRVSVFTDTDVSMLMREFRTGTPSSSEGGTLTEEEATFAFIAGVGPWLLLSFLLNAAILFLACIFSLLLAAGGKQSPYGVAARLPGMILPMLGLSLLLFIRSFIWIPLVGWFVALYLGPRMALAPALLASGEAGVMQSIRLSMKRTKGRWAFLFFSLIGAALLSIALLWFGVVLVAIAALFSMKLSFFLWLLLLMLTAACQMFFLTALAATVG